MFERRELALAIFTLLASLPYKAKGGEGRGVKTKRDDKLRERKKGESRTSAHK